MRAVVQRVTEAKVEVNDEVVGQIGRGLLVYLGVGKGDEQGDAQFMAEKLANLRIFADEAGKMNRSVQDVGGGILLVSNFTLHGDCRKGRRPGFDAAAEPALAQLRAPSDVTHEETRSFMDVPLAEFAAADELDFVDPIAHFRYIYVTMGNVARMASTAPTARLTPGRWA